MQVCGGGLERAEIDDGDERAELVQLERVHKYS